MSILHRRAVVAARITRDEKANEEINSQSTGVNGGGGSDRRNNSQKARPKRVVKRKAATRKKRVTKRAEKNG